MVTHGVVSEHPLVLSFSDLSVWCYLCEAYVHNQVRPTCTDLTQISELHSHIQLKKVYYGLLLLYEVSCYCLLMMNKKIIYLCLNIDSLSRTNKMKILLILGLSADSVKQSGLWDLKAAVSRSSQKDVSKHVTISLLCVQAVYEAKNAAHCAKFGEEIPPWS